MPSQLDTNAKPAALELLIHEKAKNYAFVPTMKAYIGWLGQYALNFPFYLNGDPKPHFWQIAKELTYFPSGKVKGLHQESQESHRSVVNTSWTVDQLVKFMAGANATTAKMALLCSNPVDVVVYHNYSSAEIAHSLPGHAVPLTCKAGIWYVSCKMFDPQQPTVARKAERSERLALHCHLGPDYAMVWRFVKKTVQAAKRNKVRSVTGDKFYMGGKGQAKGTCMAYVMASAHQIFNGSAVEGGRKRTTNKRVEGNVFRRSGITPNGYLEMCS